MARGQDPEHHAEEAWDRLSKKARLDPLLVRFEGRFESILSEFNRHTFEDGRRDPRTVERDARSLLSSRHPNVQDVEARFPQAFLQYQIFLESEPHRFKSVPGLEELKKSLIGLVLDVYRYVLLTTALDRMRQLQEVTTDPSEGDAHLIALIRSVNRIPVSVALDRRSLELLEWTETFKHSGVSVAHGGRRYWVDSDLSIFVWSLRDLTVERGRKNAISEAKTKATDAFYAKIFLLDELSNRAQGLLRLLKADQRNPRRIEKIVGATLTSFQAHRARSA